MLTSIPMGYAHLGQEERISEKFRGRSYLYPKTWRTVPAYKSSLESRVVHSNSSTSFTTTSTCSLLLLYCLFLSSLLLLQPSALVTPSPSAMLFLWEAALIDVSLFQVVRLVTHYSNSIAGYVYRTDDCHAVDILTTTGNPCTSGVFGCSPPPIYFDTYTSTDSSHKT